MWNRNPDGPAAADEIQRLTVELERREYDGIHTCSDACQRPACVLRRRVAVLEAALIRLRDCDWVITPHDRMDAVRDIARAALSSKEGETHV